MRSYMAILTALGPLLCLFTALSAYAGEPRPDAEVPGAAVYDYFVHTSKGSSEQPLTCDQGRLLSISKLGAKSEALPLSVRQAAQAACSQGLDEFSVPAYGGARFSRRSEYGVDFYAPDLQDLNAALAQASRSSAPKVYFVFNVLKPWDALMMAKDEIELLETKGFDVVISMGFVGSDLLTLLADDSTYGLVLDSHGSEPFLGFGGGHWADSNGDLVTPTQIKKVSSHLRFVTALGCYGDQRAAEYLKYLGLDAQSFHVLAGSHSENLIEYYFRSDVSAPYAPGAVWSGDGSSAEEDAKAAKLIARINFTQQIEHLLRP